MKRLVSPVRWVDQTGSCVSTVCAIHCALEPLLVLLPSIAGTEFLIGGGLERILLMGGLTLALMSLLHGVFRHARAEVFLLFGLGGLLILTGQFGYTGSTSTLMTIPGGLILAGTHLLNYRYCRTHDRVGDCSQTEGNVRTGVR